MKVGINLWTVYGFDAPEFVSESVLKVLKKLGSDGIELLVDEGNYSLRQLLNKKDELLQICASLELEIPAVASNLFWRYNPGAKDRTQREKALKLIENECIVAENFGARVVLAVAGFQEPDSNYNELYCRALEVFKEATKYAKKYKVTIAIENVWTTFLTTPREYAQFIEDVGSSYVKAYLDVGNALAMGYPENWINAVKDKIAMVHVKDFEGANGSIRGFRICGEGDLEAKGVVKALESAEYGDYLIIETPPTGDAIRYPDDGLKTAERSLKWVRKYILNRLRNT